MRARLALVLCLPVVAGLGFAADTGESEIPAPLAPFEHMIGGWKGQAIPRVNRLRGWTEKHMWAWKFEKGKPIGLTLSFENDKLLKDAALRYDAAKKQYHLEGKDPAGKAVLYVGPIDAKGRTLTLDRQGEASPEGPQRLEIRLNSNKIRYTLSFEVKPKGAPQFSKEIEMNLGKEGESFAAGSGGADLPKCILTGGAATLSVVHNGKSYPVCCSGCRDEFLADPEKYVKKAELRAKNDTSKKGEKKPARPSADDEFDGLVEKKKSG